MFSSIEAMGITFWLLKYWEGRKTSITEAHLSGCCFGVFGFCIGLLRTSHWVYRADHLEPEFPDESNHALAFAAEGTLAGHP